jgi:dTMP kinase
MLRPAMFVTFEGLDGSGKTTQVELLRQLLEEEGRTVVTTREPGGTSLGEQIREILLHSPEDIVPWAEAALFAAARSQLVEEVIAPALESGYDVICDRYIDSSLAYQGIARGVGVDRVLELNLQATRGLLPDRTFLLLVDVEESRARKGTERDRIEGEDDEFIARVDRGYRELAELFPRRILAADGTQDPNQLARLIRGQLRDLS